MTCLYLEVPYVPCLPLFYAVLPWDRRSSAPNGLGVMMKVHPVLMVGWPLPTLHGSTFPRPFRRHGRGQADAHVQDASVQEAPTSPGEGGACHGAFQRRFDAMASRGELADGGPLGRVRRVRRGSGRACCALVHVRTRHVALCVPGDGAVDVAATRARPGASMACFWTGMAMEGGERGVLGMVGRCHGGLDAGPDLPQQQHGSMHVSWNTIRHAPRLWDGDGIRSGMGGRMALSWLAGR